MDRPHDLVVFGATGFTGKLVAQYLSRNAPASLRWALAGRDAHKVEAVRAQLSGPSLPSACLTARSDDEASLRELARSTRVVVTTVGPYAKHGLPLVAACVAEGTDCCDITGEPAFVRASIERFHEAARAKHVRIVHCCGFDSVPHDLGAQFTAEQLPGEAPLRIDAFVWTKGAFSGGTWGSALNAFATARSADETRLPRAGANRVRIDSRRPRWNDELRAWAVPLPTIDPQIVARSASALPEFGPSFEYGHYAKVKKAATWLGAGAGIGALAVLSRVRPAREWLLAKLPSGDGPSDEVRRKSRFEVTFHGERDGRRAVTRVSGGDPGYDETSKMVAETALALLSTPPGEHVGVVTTAMALGRTLRERLHEAGIRFERVS